MRMRHLGADAATPPPTPALERIAGELLLQIRRDSRTGTRLGQKTAEVEDVAAGEADEGVARLGQREGEDVVVLDSLEEQVHQGVVPELPRGVELIIGNVGDPEVADRALAGVDRVVHLAAAVGVGQSMYEIARYTELNTMATARFLERIVAQRPMPIRMVVASSMSIYGEGEYTCPEHGRMAPAPRPPLRAHRTTRRVSRPVPGDRSPRPRSSGRPRRPRPLTRGLRTVPG